MTDGRSILVVDDERLIRELCSEILADAGFSVRAADGVHSALEIIDASGGFDVVLTDIRMGAVDDGLKLATAIEGRADIGSVILMSGNEVHGSLAIGSGFLLKPFTARQLAEAASI